MKRIACSGIGLVLFLGLAGLWAGAQTQPSTDSQSATSGTPLGDYARQVRRDTGTKTKPKVFDNDNLPTEDKLSVVGSKSAETADNSAAKSAESDAAAGKTPAPGTDKAPLDPAARQAAWKQWGDKITAQKDQIDLLGRELDVLQREYQLRAAAMYADAGNRLRNSTDWDKEDAKYKQQIADKQKALDDAKQKLDDMQEDARKAGVPSSVSEP